MKETIKNPENAVEYSIQKQWKRIASVVKKILRTEIRKSEKLNKICFQLLVILTRPQSLLAISIL